MNRTIGVIVKNALLIFVAVSLFSCSSDETKSGKPSSSGGTLEILVVTDSKLQWEGKVGDSIKAFFRQEYPVLPQPEPMFHLANVPAANFIKMFKSHHNILILNSDPKWAREALVETKKDFWSAPQRLVKITATTDEDLIVAFNKNRDGILKLFVELERERTNFSYRMALESKVMEKVRKNFNLKIKIPVGYSISKAESNFMWIRREPLKFSQGIIIYTQAYSDTLQFSPEQIINRRNKIVEKKIPGPRENSFMTTAVQFIAPEFKELTFDGKYAVETRGLWETEGDFMGGPFVSYTFVDESRNILYTLEAYVYAPNDEKALLLHQLESILSTTQLIEKVKE